MSDYLKFYRPTPYSSETKQQIWSTIITDAHDLHCGCTEPISHLINDLIPPDHPDRQLTVDQLIKKNYKRQLCLFGGKEEKDSGGVKEDHTTKEENIQKEREDFTDLNVEELLAAAEGAEKR